MADADLVDGDLKKAAELMKMLASEARLRSLCCLVEGERSVGELAQACGVAQPTMSQQLKRLKDAGLVEGRREAQTVYYQLAGNKAAAVLETLHTLYCAR